MIGIKRIAFIVVSLLTMLLLQSQMTHAAACADGDDDACWARFYVPGNDDDSRVYFRIFRACPDGIRIGIAANVVDEYEFYIKQYGSGQNPAFRLLTEPTTVALNDYPRGVDIEWTGESGNGFAGTDIVYFLKVFNVGWSEVFDPEYTDGIMIASPDYGYSEDDASGVVRSGDFDLCYAFNAPFENYVAPFVQCVTPGQNGTLTAVFGYYNRTRYEAIIPNGPYNRVKSRFLTAPIAASPPTLFERGVHFYAFRVTGAPLAFTWKVEGANARATLRSPRC